MIIKKILIPNSGYLRRILTLFQIGRATQKIRFSQNETEKRLAQRALVALLSDARGISLKVGQLFAAVDGSGEFCSLTDSIPALPLKTMLPILEKSLGYSAKKIFKNIQPSRAAASLGQVHLAEFYDGTPVAIKIRYPNIVNAVYAELKLADLMPRVGKIQEWGFDLTAYKKMLFDTLQCELDYRYEAQRQTYFRENVHVSHLEIPRVFDEFSSECILVQSRAIGVTFPEVIHWQESERRLIAETLLKTLFISVFVTGEIHADPHNGNAFYSHTDYDLTVTLLDFGCMMSLSETRRLALLKLILGCREKSDVNPLDCLVALGFDVQKLSHIQGTLPMLCQILFRPFLATRVFNLTEWQLEQKISTLLEEKRWWFRSAGSADVLLLMRAFQGIIQKLEQLNINLDWWSLLVSSVGELVLEQARHLKLLPVKFSTIAFRNLDFASQAKHLHVKIYKDGELFVNVSMPAEAALELEMLIPQEISVELSRSDNINLTQILQKLKMEGLTPQVLFETELNHKHYRVWLA